MAACRDGRRRSVGWLNPSFGVINSVFNKDEKSKEENLQCVLLFLLLELVSPLPQEQERACKLVLCQGSKKKNVERLIKECSSTVNIVENVASALLGALNGTPTYLFDPYAKDSRCHTQACIAWMAWSHLLSIKENLTIERFTEIKEWLKDFQGKLKISKSKFDNGIVAESVQFLQTRFRLSLLIFKEDSDSFDRDKAVNCLQILFIYFFLGIKRRHNWERNQVLCQNVDENFIGPKKVGQALYRLAKGHTLLFQDLLAKEMKLNSDIIKLEPDYFCTFVLFCNFLGQHKIPSVVFSKFRCTQCGIQKTVKFDVLYKAETFSVCNLTDLNTIGTKKHFHLKRSEPKETKDPMVPHVMICGITNFKPSRDLKYDENFDPCSGKCCDEWCKQMEDVAFEQLLLSHASAHEVEIPGLKGYFRALEGNSKIDSSYLLITHILCDWLRQGSGEPNWARVDSLSGFGK